MAKKKQTVEESKYSTFYKKNYKKFMIIPILLFIFSIIMITNTLKNENSPIYRDVTLKGGLSATLEIEPTVEEYQLQKQLEDLFPQNSFSVLFKAENGKNVGYIITTDIKEEQLKPKLEQIFETKINQDNYSSRFISPKLSNAFFKQAMIALGFSFLFMSLVVFLYFRELVPSSAVVLSAIFDIIVTVGILDLLEFKLSVAGIGAIIMLVGYSIDTDVLLTNRLVKEKGDNYFEKTFFAFKTGSLMSLTTLIAGIGAIIFTNAAIIFEIAFILAIGLAVDYISTWIQNTGILLWWLEKKN